MTENTSFIDWLFGKFQGALPGYLRPHATKIVLGFILAGILLTIRNSSGWGGLFGFLLLGAALYAALIIWGILIRLFTGKWPR